MAHTRVTGLWVAALAALWAMTALPVVAAADETLDAAFAAYWRRRRIGSWSAPSMRSLRPTLQSSRSGPSSERGGPIPMMCPPVASY